MRQDAVDGDAGCLLWKPGKLNAHKTADRVRAREGWRRDWGVR